ncbi:hypothetical protein NLX86_06520 [Streptomyces sp. A3M-1-3]|uniref:hypothetical protein n=1 Tax=Streptomyces sp. A3M-1-3 TaxID=2962044 RepID=UPI0020B7EB3A|nr:hypothetical protein [Streptomyces sp. A3M-1-3]MCP3817800.1 hypothetical protein [Streptomyces sp. A3M-1-3]
MFPFKSPRKAAQQAREEQLRQAASDAWKTERVVLDNSARLAEKYDDVANSLAAVELRLERALKACKGYRVELARRDRLIRSQQGKLDDLLGFNAPAVRDGARWQQRRPDKPGVSA